MFAFAGFFFVLFLIGLAVVVFSPPSSQRAEVKQYRVEDNVYLEGMRWKVITAHDLGSTITFPGPIAAIEQASGRFVRVHFEVENQSPVRKVVGYVGLIDSQGNEYSPRLWADSWVPLGDRLLPGTSIGQERHTYTVIFDIPRDASGLQFYPAGITPYKDVRINLGF